MAHQQPLWSGRFKEPLSEIALKFSSSVDLDKQLYQEDVAGSIAHVEMLAAVKIISLEESRRIRTALRAIAKEIDSGKLELSWEKEDVHMAIEQRLIQKIGPMGGKTSYWTQQERSGCAG
jgi:argininosuccinate lyase